MTPQEAKILDFMLKVSNPVSNRRIAGQFGWTLDYVGLLMASLKRQLLVEQDHNFFRPTNGAEKALANLENRFKFVPFAGRLAW